MKVRQEPSGCWLWTGRIHRSGYGVFKLNYKTVYAHRMAWALAHGISPAEVPALMHL
jgi:hypothetical protein